MSWSPCLLCPGSLGPTQRLCQGQPKQPKNNGCWVWVCQMKMKNVSAVVSPTILDWNFTSASPELRLRSSSSVLVLVAVTISSSSLVSLSEEYKTTLCSIFLSHPWCPSTLSSSETSSPPFCVVDGKEWLWMEVDGAPPFWIFSAFA